MNTLRTLSAALGILIFLLTTPGSSFAQQAAPAKNCNQPMRDAITQVPVPNLFSLAVTRDGCWVFTGTDLNAHSKVGVLRRDAGVITPARSVDIEGASRAMALTHDEKILVVGATNRLAFLDVEKLISGNGNPILGYIKDNRTDLATAVAITSDDRYLFASQGGTSWLTVIDLQRARSAGFTPGAIVGGIPVGIPTMGIALSPDENYIYLNSADPPDSGNWPLTCATPSFLPQIVGRTRDSGIVAIDLELAKSSSPKAVIASARSGCGANRLAVSPDGNRAYVTLTKNDELLAFDLRPVKAGAAPVLIGRVPTGPAPVDSVLFDDGKKLVVANSNQFGTKTQTTETLTVIDTAKVGEGARAILGEIPAGHDPRNMRVTADGRTLLVTNASNGGTLEIIDLERLMLKPQAAQLAKPESCSQTLSDPITNLRIGDNPWQIAATHDGCWIFISVGGGANAVGRKGVAVLHRMENKVDMVHFESIAAESIGQLKLTHDEKILILGAGSQAVFLDVDKLKSGQQNAMLGSIRDQRFAGTANLAVTSDDQYVFVSQRDTAWISVINLKKARDTGFSSAAITGGFAVGPTPGLLMSPDERYLYVSTTETVSDWNKTPTCKSSASLLKNREGAILVVDVERAKSNPTEAVIAIVEGSCRPGGLAISPDGNTLYETSLEDNALLVFDTRAIRAGSLSASIAKVPVAPVVGSVTVLDGGKRILVSSGNPFGGGLTSSKNQILSVIDSTKVSSGASAVTGQLDPGVAVTNFAVTADGRSLITTERATGTVQVIDLDRVQLQH